MAFEDFLNHKCDVFHAIKTNTPLNYGLNSIAEFKYGDTPDIADLSCHFCVKSGNIQLTQTQPYNELNARIKLILPLNADIRRNDKIVDKRTGLSYTAEEPLPIQKHHQYVYIIRDGVKGAV